MKWRWLEKRKSKAIQHPTVDLFARRTAYASLFVSALAIIVPFLQQEFARRESQREQVRIATAQLLDFPLIDNGKFANLGRLISEPWRVVISNNGQRTVSIVDMALERRDGERQIFYTGLNAGFFDLSGARLTLPLHLPAGESKILVARIGVIAPLPAYAALKPHLEKNAGHIDSMTARQLLGREKIDLYGNPVDYVEYPGGGYLLSQKQKTKFPVFVLRIATGAGQEFAQLMTVEQP